MGVRVLLGLKAELRGARKESAGLEPQRSASVTTQGNIIHGDFGELSHSAQSLCDAVTNEQRTRGIGGVWVLLGVE